MDKHAPKGTKGVTKGKCEVWFNDQIINQKHTVRTSERKWRKYVTDRTWKTYTSERNKLNRIIFTNKKKPLSEKVIRCGKDSKRLYAFTKNMCGTKRQDPMPSKTSEQEQADLFANYFHQKNC